MFFQAVQLISGVLLVVAVLMQNQGSGLGSAFGGEGSVFRAKRGAEKGLFITTIVLAAVFLASALVNFLFV
jgi:preprotein translocase subunit SecG